MCNIETGDRVICLASSIDLQIGENQIGTVNGFAKFSRHHSHEAMVRFDDGSSDWFWLYDLKKDN